MLHEFEGPLILDADALSDAIRGDGRVRVLTPHPGEMARISGKTAQEIADDRIGVARGFASAHGVILVLKGQRTVIAFPDGRVWINPTGTPAMGKGGSGDILTGLLAGMLSQFPKQPDVAVGAAVYLHAVTADHLAQRFPDRGLLASELADALPLTLAPSRGVNVRRASRPGSSVRALSEK